MGNWRTDKIEHGYHDTYMGLFYGCLGVNLAAHLGAPSYATVLEIGVGDGGGMDYFRDIAGGPVYGVDSDPGRAERAGALCANQADPLLWTKVTAHYGLTPSTQFDVIVDDASHDNTLTCLTLQHMWSAVRPGGFYVVEDWSHLDPRGMGRALRNTVDRLPLVASDEWQPRGLVVLQKNPSTRR